MAFLTCPTFAALQAASPSDGDTAYLTETERGGLFVFRAGNYSGDVAIDSQHGIYVPLNTDPAGSSGVWIRQLPKPGEWHVDWFGVPHDPESGNGGPLEKLSHAELTAVVNLAKSKKPARIVFGAKIYTLGGQIPKWNYQVELVGSVGPQGTILVKRYVESNNVRGVLAFEDHGFTVRNISVNASSGSGGSGISAVLTFKEEPVPNIGLAVIEDCIVSGGQHFNWSVYCSGYNNTSEAAGYRGFYIRGGQIFGAKEASIGLTCVQHFFFDGAFATNSPHEVSGSNVNALVLQGAGSATNPSDDWQVHGVMAGKVNLNWLSRSVIVSPQIGDINVDANTTSVRWYGPTVTGLVNNNAGTGFVRA